MNDEAYIQHAIALAKKAADTGEVPVGALIVQDDKVIAEAWNQPIATHDPTAHAEVVALRAAGRSVNNYRLTGATLYVTLEPCAMCVGALIHARIARVVFGAYDPKAGAVESAIALSAAPHFNHRIDFVGGVLAEDCAELLTSFFKKRRA